MAFFDFLWQYFSGGGGVEVIVWLTIFVSYVFAGFVSNAWICLPVSFVLLFGTLFVIKTVASKKNNA
jgi:hypothetical protein